MNIANKNRGASHLWLALAAFWVLGFSAWFHSMGLPSAGDVPRTQVWMAIPFDLLDLFDPPSGPRSTPWSWFYLLQRIPFLLIGALFWLGAWGLGSLSLRPCQFKLAKSEQHFFALCAGMSILTLIILGLGLFAVLSRWTLGCVLMAGFVGEVWCRRQSPSPQASAALSQPDSDISSSLSSFWMWTAISISLLFTLVHLFGAITPQNDFDACEYHLGGPKEWFQLGQIVRLPHNVYTSFPFLSEMLVLGGMSLYGDWEWGALAGQAALAGFAPVTALGLYAAGCRWFSKKAGLLAALVYLTSPWTYRISIIVGAEGSLSCYLFASLFALLLFKDQLAERPAIRMNFLFASLVGAMSGSAMSCKYPGFVSSVIPIGFLVILIAFFAFSEHRLRFVVISGVGFAMGVMLAVGPWLLKNTVETGNPVYPLAVGIFGGIDRDEELDSKFRKGHANTYKNWTERARDLPRKLTDAVALNNWHSPLMFGLAPLSMMWWRRRRTDQTLDSLTDSRLRFVLAISWTFIAWQFLTWWLLTHHIDRFYVPMFSCVALLAGAGAACDCSCFGPLSVAGTLLALRKPPNLAKKVGGSPAKFPTHYSEQARSNGAEAARFSSVASSGIQIAWCGFIATLIAASIFYNAEIMLLVGGFNAGRMDLVTANHRAIQSSVSPRIGWLNEEFESGRLPPTTKLLCVGVADLFHARYPYFYNTVFDHSIFERLCVEPVGQPRRLRPVEEIRAEFRRLGITHVEVSWAEILRYRAPGSYGYTDFAVPETFSELQRIGLLGRPLELPPSVSLGELTDDVRSQLSGWGDSLMIIFQEKPAYISGQIYPVLLN